MKTITITRQSKNLGLGWTNQPKRNEPAIEAVETADVTGNWHVIDAEWDRARRLNSGGTWYRVALFVGGKKITENKDEISMALSDLRTTGEAKLWVKS